MGTSGSVGGLAGNRWAYPEAAEKAIKAFLVQADQPFGKTHDLEALVTLAAGVESRLAPWIEVADSLTPYATTYRYPGDAVEPDPEEFARAIETAHSVYQLILSLVPPEARPNQP